MSGNEQSSKMKLKNVMFRNDQLEWLRRKHEKDGTTASQFIRIALDKLIEEKEKKE